MAAKVNLLANKLPALLAMPIFLWLGFYRRPVNHLNLWLHTQDCGIADMLQAESLRVQGYSEYGQLQALRVGVVLVVVAD